MDYTFIEHSILQIGYVMELLNICMKTTYLQCENKFCQQNDSTAMGNSVSQF
jgi:hypothetical protein